MAGWTGVLDVKAAVTLSAIDIERIIVEHQRRIGCPAKGRVRVSANVETGDRNEDTWTRVEAVFEVDVPVGATGYQGGNGADTEGVNDR